MRKTLAIIIVSTVLGGLFGSYITVTALDRLPWAHNNNFQTVISKKVVETQESAVIDVVKKASPSVVSVVIKKDVTINNYQVDPFFQNFFNNWPFLNNAPNPTPQPQQGQTPNWQKVGGGTGFIISADGLILTNKHVVSDDSAHYSVILNDGKEYEAKVIGTDLFNDVGVLKIDAKNLPIVEFGDSDKLVIGQSVIAIGNALAEFSNTVTTGVVSGIGRSIVAASGPGSSEKLEDVIQTDAAINPGNSGGPLLNLSGQVIGINTAISDQGQSIGFAIPINTVKSVIDSVKQNGEIVRPYLGVRYIMLTSDIVQKSNISVSDGALIVQGDTAQDLAITPGSPADKAGLAANDVILEFNGKKLNKDYDLSKAMSQAKPGDQVTLKILSKGETKELEVTLEQYKQ